MELVSTFTATHIVSYEIHNMIAPFSYYVCGVMVTLLTPKTISFLGLDWELSYLVAIARLSFQVLVGAL